MPRRMLAAWGLALSLPAMAHHLFLMPSAFQVSPGERITVGFHNGDTFPDSEVPPALARLRDATLYAGKLQYNVTNIRVDGNRALGDVRAAGKGTLVIAARTTPNFIEMDPPAFEKYLKGEGMGQVVEWRVQHGESAKPGREIYSKYVKALVRSDGAGDDTYSKPVGHAVELVPDKDPYSLKTRDTLPVRLLWRGKPASNVMVEAAIAPSAGPAESLRVGRTDANGYVNVYLSKAGKWRLTAIVIERSKDPSQADWESFWSSLTFELSR